MYIPLIAAVISIFLIILLFISEKNGRLDTKIINVLETLGIEGIVAERLVSTLRGFLLIIALSFILGAALFYF